ncbi:MAG: UDP-3-O-(3-hydroxymyristoyl)glucosamine N-acyltransferase [Chthoniobacter sp.]|nr:UDP-3-O-(3-hydroxymyristoyl)glucosamine N-acyltransferase [Chthoniobacter sp.]
MSFTALEIARIVQGEVLGDETTPLSGLSSIDGARAGDLAFAEKESQFLAAEQGAATAILSSAAFTSSQKIVIRVPNPRVAFARLLPVFFPVDEYPAGTDASARIAASAQVDPSAHIGPNCVIGERVQIGPRSVLMGGNHVRKDARIGEDTSLYPNVVIYERTVIADRVTIHAGSVIGSDGYGYVFDAGSHRKVLQVGNVVIHNDVEIGANCAIDRGALDSTVIGAGTKIDNLVHIAHNVVIGRHCLIMGQVGFAGSTHLGDYVVIASQSGIAGHLSLGTQSTVGAKSGVMRDIPAKGTVLGIPAMPDKQAKRQWIAVQQLPEMIRRLRDLEKQVAQWNEEKLVS